MDGRLKDDPAWEAERNPCRNVALQRKEEKQLLEAPSDVAGKLNLKSAPFGQSYGVAMERGETAARINNLVKNQKLEQVLSTIFFRCDKFKLLAIHRYFKNYTVIKNS